MAGNVLWTSVFNKPDSQSQDLTRQRIVQEERCGRRPATVIKGPEFDELVRGKGDDTLVRDPWKPKGPRHSVQPPLVGYGGSVPLVRPEHTGENKGEHAYYYTPHFGSEKHAAMLREAPAGGASALGTKPFAVPGTRSELPALPPPCLLAPHVQARTLALVFTRLHLLSSRSQRRRASASTTHS